MQDHGDAALWSATTLTSSEKAVLKRELRQALSEALRHFRERRPGKPSQEVLADEVGMDRSYWGDLERGERSLTLFNLWRMARALNVSPSRLVLAIDQRYRRLSRSGPAEVSPRTPGERQLQHLKEFMNEALTMKWLADRNEKTVHANRLLLDWMGITLEELKGDGWKQTVHPEDMPEYYPILHKAFLRRHSTTTRFRLRNGKGEFVWVAQEAGPRFTPKGEFIGFMGTIIEIADSTGLPKPKGKR
jgi:PAS domain S-box-containing protein